MQMKKNYKGLTNENMQAIKAFNAKHGAITVSTEKLFVEERAKIIELAGS